MIWFSLSNSLLFYGWLWILFLLPLLRCYHHFWRLLSHFFLFCLQFDDCFCLCNPLDNALQCYFAFETSVTFKGSSHVPSLFFCDSIASSLFFQGSSEFYFLWFSESLFFSPLQWIFTGPMTFFLDVLLSACVLLTSLLKSQCNCNICWFDQHLSFVWQHICFYIHDVWFIFENSSPEFWKCIPGMLCLWTMFSALFWMIFFCLFCCCCTPFLLLSVQCSSRLFPIISKACDTLIISAELLISLSLLKSFLIFYSRSHRFILWWLVLLLSERFFFLTSSAPSSLNDE